HRRGPAGGGRRRAAHRHRLRARGPAVRRRRHRPALRPEGPGAGRADRRAVRDARRRPRPGGAGGRHRRGPPHRRAAVAGPAHPGPAPAAGPGLRARRARGHHRRALPRPRLRAGGGRRGRPAGHDERQPARGADPGDGGGGGRGPRARRPRRRRRPVLGTPLDGRRRHGGAVAGAARGPALARRRAGGGGRPRLAVQSARWVPSAAGARRCVYCHVRMGTAAGLRALVTAAPGGLRTLRGALTTWVQRDLVAAAHARPPPLAPGSPPGDDGPEVLASWYVVVAPPDRWRVVGRGHLAVSDGERSWVGTSTLVTERPPTRASIHDGGVVGTCIHPAALLEGLL